MRVIPASPRQRRRLLWAAGLLAVAGAVATLAVVTAPNDRALSGETGSRGPGWVPPEQPSAVPRSNAELREPLAVAELFVSTAVARKHVERSWDIVTRELKQGFTRVRWSQSDIPIVPYPVDATRWQLDYSYADQIGLKVTIFPPQGSAVRPTVFNLDLRASDAAGKRRWLVSAFTPVREVSALPGSQTEASPSNPPRSERGSEAHLSAVWLLVPLGVLGLALLIPVVLGIAYWLRVRRAERDWARGRLGLVDGRELDEVVRRVHDDA